MSKPVIHLLIPQLLQSLSGWNSDFLFTPTCSNLSLLLRKYVVFNSPKVHGLNESFFKIIEFENSELPIAHYRFQIHHANFLSSGMLCADPVHFEVGMNDIILTEKITDLSIDDAQQLIELLNQHFKQDGLEFIFGSNQHWTISFPDNESIQTTPIDLVLKKNIVGKLASSPQRNWQAIQNEVQMLLHSSNVNQQREIAGLTSINSLWFWGGGQPQSQVLKQDDQKIQNVFSDFDNNNVEIEGKTFAKAANCNWQALPRNGEQLINHFSGLNIVILDQLFMPAIQGNINVYQDELTKLDGNIIKPLLQAWQQDKIDIIIDDCDGNSIKPIKPPAWKFWVNPKPLSEVLK